MRKENKKEDKSFFNLNIFFINKNIKIMKKNFLLLMLMALVSLTASAVTDISTSTKIQMSTGNVTYGGSEAPTIQLLDEGYKMTTADDYTWDGKYYTTEACTTEATGTISTLTAGTYWIQVEGKGVYTGKKAQSFEVEKKAVSVAVAGTFSKTYGAADPALTSDDLNWSSASGFVGSDDKTVFTGTLTYTYEGTNVGTYPVTVSGMTADNYTLTITGGITINSKPITAEMITAVELTADYKSAAYDEFAVDVKDGSTPLVAGTDFDVKAYNEVGMTSEATPTSVATYYLAIEGKAGANYSVTPHLAAGTFEIKKVGLRIAAVDKTKVYDGNITSLPAGDAYTVTGLKGSDAVSSVTEITTSVEGNANVGNKTIKLTSNTTGKTLAGNYDINLVNGTLTIDKRPITIKANDATKKYNQADEDATGYNSAWPTSAAVKGYVAAKGYSGVTVSYTDDDTKDAFVSTEEAKTFFGQYKTSSPNNTYAGIYVAKKSGTSDNKGDYEDALEVKVTNSSAAVLSNYAITYDTGDYSIAGGKIYVTAEAKTKKYGDEDPELTYVVDGLSEGDALTTEPTLTREEGENVGPHTINISGAVAPAGYEEIVYATATLTIEARPLKVTAKTQTLKIGQTAANLDQTLYEITEGTLNDDDEVADVFSLSFATTASTDPVVQVPNMSAAGTYKGGIFYTAGTKASNYAITFTNGDLVVVAADAIVLSKTNANTIATKADATVTFDDFALAADRWYAMTLPFAVTPAQLSATTAFGYAVTDVLDQTNSSESKVRFVLNMTTIPANTPFIFKLAEAKNMNQVVFTSVDVTAPASEDVLVVTDAAENQFIGTYAGVTFTTPDKDYIISISDGDIHPAAAGAKVRPLGAYIKTKASWASAPVFEIEEIDGSVTTIKAIETVNAAVATDGWYTINGVRLQGAPTEKGIYINNGKKIVIK